MTADVVTGEAVALDVRLAQWPSRLVAFAIDVAAQYLCYFALNLVIAAVIVGGADVDMVLALALVALVLVVVGYPVVFETFMHGRTPGKAAMGLCVVRDDGGPERFRHALARGLLMPFEFWGPALLTSIFSRRAKRLGDLLAGTIVVQQRVPGGTQLPVAMPPPLAGWAAGLDLARMPDELALSCRQFLLRQHELTPAARNALGSQLVASVRSTVNPAPPPGTPGWAYLAAVVAERRRREEWRLYLARQQAQSHRPGAAWTMPYPQPTLYPQAQPRPQPAPQPQTAPGPFAPPE